MILIYVYNFFPKNAVIFRYELDSAYLRGEKGKGRYRRMYDCVEQEWRDSESEKQKNRRNII